MFLPEELDAPALIIDTSLGPTWGFVLVMSFISVALWGITCAQVYFYYSNYAKDAAYVRFTVIWLWIFDTTREILVIIAVYDALINGFGNFTIFAKVGSANIWQSLFTAIINTIAQCFLFYRIWRLGGSNPLILILLFPFILFGLAGTSAYVALLLPNPTVQNLETPLMQGLNMTISATKALVDIIISCSLILYLRVKRVENASGRNKRMVRHLVLLSLITGSWCAFNSLAVFAIWPTNLVYFGIIIITSPVYCNTVLAHLNARNHFRALVSADPTDCPEDLEDLNCT